MHEARLYRATMIPVVLAAVILMFSVVSRPEPLRTEEAPDAFDGNRAAALAERLAEVAPEPLPGSEDDEAAGDFVAARLAEIPGGEVTEQELEGTFDGEDVTLRNVNLLLPGETEERLVVVAARDCAEPPCAASAATTGALLELASAVADTQHTKTVQFVSTDGSAAGGVGADALADELTQSPPEAVLVIRQPGAPEPRPPFVITGSAGARSASVGLTESAEVAVRPEFGPESELPRETFASLLGLAVPAGLGDQAVLISRGLDAIGLSSYGSLPPDPGSAAASEISPESLARVGRSALSLFLALDAAPVPPERGPDAFVPLAGKLLPEWSLALLGLALLLPVGIVSAAVMLRLRRRAADLGAAGLWVAVWSAPFAAVLLLAYLLDVVGLLPGPRFPYVPGLHAPQAGGIVASVLLLAALIGGIAFARRVRRRPDPAVAPAAVGVAAFLAVAVVWLINPFLALLAAPALHLWPSAAGLTRSPVRGALALIIGLIPAAGVLVFLGDELGVGGLAPWHLLLFVSGHHLSFLTALCACVMAGCLAAAIDALTGPRPRRRLDAYASTRS